MKMHTLLKTVIISFITPIISIFVVDRFNLFEYIKFDSLSSDKIYEMGLTAYMTIVGVIINLIYDFLESKRTSIVCIFYTQEKNINIENTPLVVCDDEVGYTSISCHIEAKGNLKRLKKCKLNLSLPSWLDTQLNSNNIVVDYCDRNLIWNLGNILQQNSSKQQYAQYSIKIPLLKNDGNDSSVIEIDLAPEMKKKIGINFKTNTFKVRNRD